MYRRKSKIKGRRLRRAQVHSAHRKRKAMATERRGWFSLSFFLFCVGRAIDLGEA